MTGPSKLAQEVAARIRRELVLNAGDRQEGYPDLEETEWLEAAAAIISEAIAPLERQVVAEEGRRNALDRHNTELVQRLQAAEASLVKYQEAVRLKICKYLEDHGGIGAIEESCDPVDFILASHNVINQERKDLQEKFNALGDADYVLNVDRTWKAKQKEIDEAIAMAEKWKKRALAFQEGYRNSQFENTAKEIQLMCLRAEGADKFTENANKNLRVKVHAGAIERDELKQALREALSEISEHNSEYQHRTPQEKLDVWLQLVK